MEGMEDGKDDKEERIKRMKSRGAAWMTRRFVKELVLEMINNASMVSETRHIKNMVEGVLEETVMRVEMNRIMDSLESVGGMEPRIYAELIERDKKRKKKSRLARRM